MGVKIGAIAYGAGTGGTQVGRGIKALMAHELRHKHGSGDTVGILAHGLASDEVRLAPDGRRKTGTGETKKR